MNSSVIVAGARTPIGRLQGSLASLSAVDLGGIAIAATLENVDITPAQVEYVILGQVLTAGSGQMPARQAATKAGIPMTTPALNINKVCLSGIESVILADQLIRAGAFDIIVAGGMESMSQAPHLLTQSRSGFKYGNATLVDHLAFDGLHDAYTDRSMGVLTETGIAQHPQTISRQEQDGFAARSHLLATRAWANGIFDDEVIPVQPHAHSDAVVRDENIRSDTSVESLSRLPSTFSSGGTVTAGNASPINDGAAAILIMSKQRAQSEGLAWLAEIVTHGIVAGPDSGLLLQPANAIATACATAKLQPSELDIVEINEAFAAVVIASTRALALDPARPG